MSRKSGSRGLLALRSTLTAFLTLDNAKNLLLWYTVYIYVLAAYRTTRAQGLIETATSVYLKTAQYLYNIILSSPQGRKKLKAELSVARADLKHKLITEKEGQVNALLKHDTLPLQGRNREQLKTLFDELEKIQKAEWETGKVSGAIYHGHSEGTELGHSINDAMQRFLLSNPLHPDVFPGVRKMEAEIIAMTLGLFNARPGHGCGTTTSGGTESIIMACKAYRDWAKAERGITRPEMVIPASAHAAFDKAGEYFGITVRHIPVDSVTRKVDLRRVKRAMNANTIMLVGSAPNFPDGIIDPIPELSKLAVKYKVPLHVDCCLGSFIVPFLEEAGYPIELFDFRLPGVTSISCDTHKYGFAPKGSSIIMYSEPKWRHYQYFCTTQWPGGVYASPSIAGSRAGALLAGAWAALLSMGREGYLESCKQIVGAARKIEHGIRDSIPELCVLGNPQVTVIAFKSDSLDILAVGDKMSEKGWHLNALQHPPAVHICCTRLTVPAVDRFLRDLREAVNEVKSIPEGGPQGTMVQIYGLGKSQISGSFIVSEFVKLYLDVLYDV